MTEVISASQKAKLQKDKDVKNMLRRHKRKKHQEQETELMNAEAPTPLLATPPYDFYADSIGYHSGSLRGGLYYYLILKKDIDRAFEEFEGVYDGTGKKPNYMIIPPIEAVQSVYYAPYYEESDFATFTYGYDEKRFPLVGATDQDIKVQGFVRRIVNQAPNKQLKQVGEPQRLDYFEPSLSGARFDWRNEGKLWNFPFTYGTLTDSMSDPLIIKPHLLTDHSSEQIVNVKVPLTSTGIYSINVEGYKRDTGFGFVTDTMSTKPRTIPIVASAYASYMNQTQSQIEAQKKSAAENKNLGITGALVTAGVTAAAIAAAPFTGGGSLAVGASVLAGAATAGTGIYKANKQYDQTIRQLQASGKDYSNTPNRLTDGGSLDVVYTTSLKVLNAGPNQEAFSGLDYVIMRQPDHVMEKAALFFHMYGYAQNKMMPIQELKRSRYYYNYMKTVGANINVKNTIPKSHYQQLKNIHDSGITVWHVDRAGVQLGDYSMDNYEV